MKYEKIAEYSNTNIQRITGVKRATYDKVVEILRKGYAEKHRRRGRTPKLSIEDLLLVTQGLALIHPNSLLPKKRSKNHPLSKQERKDNREIAKQRIFVEHAIRFVKRFRILSERYRNRRNRFTLRVPAPLKGEGDRLRWRGSLLPAFSIQLPKDKRDKRA